MPVTVINSSLDEQVHFAIFSGYFDYEECMQPIVRTCPEGVRRVYEVENEWHKLVEIANYQCNSALTGKCFFWLEFAFEVAFELRKCDEC